MRGPAVKRRSRDRYRAGKRLWSHEDERALRARYPHEPTAALARDLRRTVAATYGRAQILGLAKTTAYMASPAACRLRRGDNVGAAYRFRPGHVPANKGLRRPGWGPGRMRETQFKPGTRSGIAVELYRPIGTERVSKDGYLERKINDDFPLQRRWRAVHLLLWEAARGPVPAGHVIAFRNRDKRDVRIENLECITLRDHMLRNSVHNLPEPLARTVQLLGALNRHIRRKAKANEKSDRRPPQPPLRDHRGAEGRGTSDGARPSAGDR